MSFFIAIAIMMLIIKATPAIVKRIEGGGLDTGSRERLDELDHRLQETEEQLRRLVSATDSRLVDLEERQDVTERVLQRVKERKALPEG